jgi:LPXTG-motif cell wall-anchored protein
VEQESDPTSDSDCTSVATNANRVTITEVEVFRAQGKSVVAPVVTPPAIKPIKPVTSGGRLPATGGSTALALGSMVMLGLGGVVLVLRRRTV